VRALCALFVLKLSVKGNSAEAFWSSAAPRDTMPMKLCACLYLLVALTAARAPGDVLFRAAGVTDAQRAKLTVPSFAAAALLELSQLSRAGVDEQKQVLMAQKLASVFDPQRHTGLDVRVRKSTASQVAGTLWSLSQQQPNSHTAAVKARPNSSPPNAPPPVVLQAPPRRAATAPAAPDRASIGAFPAGRDRGVQSLAIGLVLPSWPDHSWGSSGTLRILHSQSNGAECAAACADEPRCAKFTFKRVKGQRKDEGVPRAGSTQCTQLPTVVHCVSSLLALFSSLFSLCR
jgi:hypothetical protein